MSVVLLQLSTPNHALCCLCPHLGRICRIDTGTPAFQPDFIHKPLISRDLLLLPHWKGTCIAISRKHSEALMLVLERGIDNGVLTRSTYTDEKQLSHSLRLRTWGWVEIDALLSAGEVWIGKYFFRLQRDVEMPGTRIREVAPQRYDELLTADDRKFLWAMGISLAQDQRGEEGHDRSERRKRSAGPGARRSRRLCLPLPTPRNTVTNTLTPNADGRCL